MKLVQGSTLETLTRVQAFLDANGVRFAAINQSTARQKLDSMIVQFQEQAVDQGSGDRGSRGETARQRELRLALRIHFMRAVATAAKLKLRDVPEFKTLTMPDPHVSVQQLIAAAGTMAESATKYEAALTEAGLPAGFVTQLEAAIEKVRDSITVRGTHLERRVGATAALKAQTNDGRKVIKLLDSLVLPVIGSDPTLVAQWKLVKRISRKPGPVTGSEAQAAVVATEVIPPETPKAA